MDILKADERAPALTPAADFMTAALRSWLVNQLLSDGDLAELPYLLLELGYTEVPAPEACRDFLKREMSRLAGLGENQALIRLCEGLIQFYLLQHPRECPELEQLNRFLPPGLAFSNLSGHLLFEPEHYYQPHNFFVQEQAHWVLSGRRAPEVPPARAALPGPTDGPEPANIPEAEPESGPQASMPAPEASPASPPVPEAPLASPPAAQELAHAVPRNGDERSQQFREIRKRRLQLLKEWENGTGESQ